MRKSRGTFLIILGLCSCLGGCSGVEPEKRNYPLIMSVDYQKKGYEVTYGLPDLQASTGQDKSEENGDNPSVLFFTGKTLKEVRASYDSSQEKYLDLGHLQILVLGDSLISQGKWMSLFLWLRENPEVGEDIYLFSTSDTRAVMELNGKLSSSLGEYLIGIYENRPGGQKKQSISLRKAYGTMLEEGKLPDLPVLKEENGSIRILFPAEE